MKQDFIVTPWKVEGKIDYAKLEKEFGIQEITRELVDQIETKAGFSHWLLRRKIYFAHREVDRVLQAHNKGSEFYLYTGRGPSGKTHLGHLMPYLLTKYLQDAFNVKLYYMLTDDEKFLFKENLSLEQTKQYALDNALDFLAIGFKPDKTKIIIDTDAIGKMYKIALKVAKKSTFSTAKAVFGFTNESKIGQIFFPAIQSAPAFIESEIQNKKVYCIIPCAIDQDPHWRLTRDVAEKIGYPKPATIEGMFLPGLEQGGKMSASEEKSAIFTTDSKEDVNKKVLTAFTGGQPTTVEQKKNGGKPESCNVFTYYNFLFEPNDQKLKEKYEACKNGSLMCGECKKELSEKINKFLANHQQQRQKAKEKLEDYLWKDN